MNTRTHAVTITVAALVMASICSASAAQNRHGGQGGNGHRGGNISHGYHHGDHAGHGGHWGGGQYWGGIGLGAGLGLGAYYLTRPWYPDEVVILQPPTVYYDAPTILQTPLLRALPTAPDPIFYPRMGQNAGLAEADRQSCNRWAATQPAAMAEASVFQRAILACMDGRGYTSR